MAAWAIAWVVGGALGATACGGKLPVPAAAAACNDRNDRCALMNCPGGSTCTLDSSCSPRCEPQQLRPHY